MTTAPENNQSQDEKLLAQLYKEGAKETPSAKINHEIINYAKNADRAAPSPEHIGSHFGGDWKVPLSLAASVVVVFALLVQLDQTPQQLELPPIPEISIPSESQSLEDAYPVEESTADDISSLKRNIKESELDSQKRTDPDIDESRINQSSGQEIQENLQEGMLEKAKSKEVNALNINKPSAAKKQVGKSIDDSEKSISEATPNNVMQPKSTNEEFKHQASPSSRKDTLETSDIAVEKELEINTNEFAPIPVEDWLLMIETLVARKDYAEAARQLEKFKQAHPNVNVEDLDAKIP